MKKRCTVILFGLIVLLGAIISNRLNVSTESVTLTTSEASIPSEAIAQAINYKEGLSKAELQAALYYNESIIGSLEMQLQTLIPIDQRLMRDDIYTYFINLIEVNNLKYQEQSDIILAAEEAEKKEALLHSPTQTQCQEDKYVAATYIWNYLHDQGFNDYVSAGILGNIMTEVGGNTLYIQWWLYGPCYYGMCQWNNAYTQVWGTDLKTQCDFLMSNIRYEIDTFGFVYQSGFKYNNFCQLQDARAAARCFAQSYERCGSGSYGIRESNALIAYNYFVG